MEDSLVTLTTAAADEEQPDSTARVDNPIVGDDAGGGRAAPDGASLKFILGRFADECTSSGVDWSLPSSTAEWRERLSRAEDGGPRLSATTIEGLEADGHHHMPALFGGDATTQHPGPFQLVSADVTDVIQADGTQVPLHLWWKQWRHAVDRTTVVRAVPMRRDGSPCDECAVQVTLGQLCLRRTRDLVYNYIGDLRSPGVTNDRRETYIEYAQRTCCPTAEDSDGSADEADFEDFGPAHAFLSHSWGGTFADTVDAVLPNPDQCYCAMVEPSREGSRCCILFLMCALLHVALVFFVPGWGLLLVALGRRAYVLDHIANPRWWTPKAVRRLGAYRLWIDIFCKNQHIVNSDGTAEELRDCVTGCGTTILACTPWDEPALFKRVWCQYEIHHSMLTDTEVVIRYPDSEKRRMDKGIYNWAPVSSWFFCCGYRRRQQPEGQLESTLSANRAALLGNAVSRIKVCDAIATVASDRELILRQIASSYGGDPDVAADNDVNRLALAHADQPIQTEIFAGIFEALGGARRKVEANAVRCGWPPRRPRKVPWGTRVAMYTSGFQLMVVVAGLMWFGYLPYLLLWLILAIVGGVIAGVTINMAAKTHQLCVLLASADPSGTLFRREATVFRRERAFCLTGCVLGLVLCVSAAGVGGWELHKFVSAGRQFWAAAGN